MQLVPTLAVRDARSDLIAAIGDVLRRMARSDRIGVAVSGGGDSMALLLAAVDWAEGSGATILAATVDHGLRTESADEARRVAYFCGARRIEHRTLAVDNSPMARMSRQGRGTIATGACRTGPGRPASTPSCSGIRRTTSPKRC